MPLGTFRKSLFEDMCFHFFLVNNKEWDFSVKCSPEVFYPTFFCQRTMLSILSIFHIYVPICINAYLNKNRVKYAYTNICIKFIKSEKVFAKYFLFSDYSPK